MFRHCYNCGTFLSVSSLCMCVRCESRLRGSLSQQTHYVYQGDNKIAVTALFEWDFEKGPLMSHWIRSIKGGVPESAFFALAEMLVQQKAKKFNDIPNNSILIPSPSVQLKERDHASALALAISELTELPVVLALKRGSPGSQKNLSVTQRRKRALLLLENFSTNDFSNKNIYFVDDVVTTGSTALSAYFALGKPRNFEVLSICYRPSLKFADISRL